MGIRYRKSINLGGGFRINLSKSGIGYSWGVPGYRYTKTATGKVRKTYSIPGTGISYVEEHGNRKKNTRRVSEYLPENNMQNTKDIESASIDNFQSAEYSDVIKIISRNLKLNTLSTILIIIGICLCCVPYGWIILILSIIFKMIIYIKGKVSFDYEMDDYYLAKHNARMASWQQLNSCDKLWQITQSGDAINVKKSGGANRIVDRKQIKLSTKLPFYLTTNVQTFSMLLKKERIIVLPDKLLIVRGSKIGIEEYDKVTEFIGTTIFIEDGAVPRDATVVGTTWKYVNKNGSPDKRFKDNRQLPKCQYGLIQLTSVNGINVELQCSDYKKAQNLRLSNQ